MIQTHKGNLLDLTKGILVHGCNCLGVMGGGIAVQIKKKWGGVYAAYKIHEDKLGLVLGDIVAVDNKWEVGDNVLYRDPCLPPDLVVVNAMTQQTCGSDKDTVYVNYDAISACFARVKLIALETGLDVHFPLIGCGLANGKWEEVEVRIEAALGPDINKHLWVL